MKNWREFCESKEQEPLSDDINEKDLELDDDKSKDEWEIQEVLDIFNDPKDIPKDTLKESVIGANTDLSNKEVKRGDIVWITALLKRKGSSMNSPSVQGVLKLRVVDMWYGLSRLNNIIKK